MLDQLLAKRKKLLDSIEVMNFAIAETNRDITNLIKEKYLGRSIQFSKENNIIFVQQDMIQRNIPWNINYLISAVDIPSASGDIHFKLDPVDRKNLSYTELQSIYIRFTHLKNFIFT